MTAARPGCPSGASRARSRSSGCCSTSERAFKVADYVIGHAPRSDRTRDLARKLDQQGRRLEFLRRYLDLYQEYAQAELQFSDLNTMALYHSLSEADQATFAFDTAVVDWKVYLQDIHCPAVTAPIRRLDEIRARAQAAVGRRQEVAWSEELDR